MYLSICPHAMMFRQFSFPHQWLEGNLPAGSRCIVCHKTCGSVKRLQDYRCLWCKGTVRILFYFTSFQPSFSFHPSLPFQPLFLQCISSFIHIPTLIPIPSFIPIPTLVPPLFVPILTLIPIPSFILLSIYLQVHTDCRDIAEPICSLGSLVTSTLPPSAVKQSDEIIYNMWEVCTCIYDNIQSIYLFIH